MWRGMMNQDQAILEALASVLGVTMTDDLDIPEFLRRDKNAPAVKASDNVTVPAADNTTCPECGNDLRDPHSLHCPSRLPIHKPDAEAEKWRIMEEQRRE